MSNNIAMPEETMRQHEGSGPMSGIPVNPITGQRLDMEESGDVEPMSQEEKEREAERLFVLFERYVSFSYVWLFMLRFRLLISHTGLKRRVLWMLRIPSRRRIALGGFKSCLMMKIKSGCAYAQSVMIV
jgi:hypothetical protein